MSWVLDLRALNAARPDLIGPGRLVLVVGPSGVGKDTLIRGAQTQCADDTSIVFPRRVVTRPPSAAEDHDMIDAKDFDRAVAKGAFALWWDAHGNRYGIPSTVDDEIRTGRTVVCNVSRAIVTQVRRRYASVSVVLITAPQHVLESRLARRNRPSDSDLTSRVRRSGEFDLTVDADFVIRNVGRPEVGIRKFISVIRDSGFFIVF